ncbi:MAG: hypothetical protein ABI442_20210 [Gemmatimonadaceae bacterium]
MKCFFDNCISSNLTEAMRLLVAPIHEIEHLAKDFSADALDAEWLQMLAERKDAILVSADPTIATAKKEREVWRSVGVTPVFFGGNFSQLPIWTQVCEVVNWWPEIVRTAKDAPRGAGFFLSPKAGKKTPKPICAPYGTGNKTLPRYPNGSLDLPRQGVYFSLWRPQLDTRFSPRPRIRGAGFRVLRTERRTRTTASARASR